MIFSKLKTLAAAFGLSACLAASLGFAGETFKPAVVYDLGGKFDKSFNQGVWTGVERFVKDTGIKVTEFEVKNEGQREQAYRRLAQRGATFILGVGFGQADAIDKIAAEFPNKKFAIIDVSWLNRPNLRQYIFKEEEGSYLVGVAAAMKSQTGKVGFVGGMDIGLIRKFACGYAQGVKSVGSDIRVYQNMTGTTPAAWNDPAKGSELARSQIDRGADVVYHAAGGTGMGVIQAAADSGKLAIGVDMNQNALAPGSVLTSMVKRVDVAAHEALMAAKTNTLTAGVVTLGLAQDGVGYSLDEHNADLLTPNIREAMNAKRQDIISGKVKVHNYETNNKCPV